jgi:DNA helicase-2/ATP-dependent DNA helicase PcrA
LFRLSGGSGRGCRYGRLIVLDGLNPEQRRAAETVRGPVCILAGAGSGKTTTVTRRIAWQVASAAFRPDEILAVTFTDKAAGVMKARLAALGVAGVEARTFHSAALRLLHRYRPGAVGKILPGKALLLRQIANGLPRSYRFRPAGDLATEIERAKARRIRPEGYLESLGEHEPPIPPDLMSTVYREYERRKDARGELDFEDLLEGAIGLLEGDSRARTDVQERYRAVTVDEYQDVNLLQQTLLELWVGARVDLCVVGDDYQSIYAFTGASPRWLLDMARRYPQATVIRLEENYRSSPEILELANRLVPRLGGAPKVLRPTRGTATQPTLRAFPAPADEDEWIVTEIKRIAAVGISFDETAILCRTNSRLADFEEVLHEAGLPFQGSSLLEREAARRLLRLVEGDTATGVAARIRLLAEEAGWLPVLPDRLGERELTRQADLARLVRLAEAFDDGEQTCGDFAAELRRRFDPGGESARGVHLLTYHRAKGLEFDAVFLPRLHDKELPSRFATNDEELAEERRLLYVGITRARRELTLTWSKRPSPFLAELGVQPPAAPQRASTEPLLAGEPEQGLYRALSAWRLARARIEEVPAYIVFHNRVLAEIADSRPRSRAELAAVPGVGPSKLERYGDEVLDLVNSAG